MIGYIGTECGSEPIIPATELPNPCSIKTGDNIPQPCNNSIKSLGLSFRMWNAGPSQLVPECEQTTWATIPVQVYQQYWSEAAQQIRWFSCPSCWQKLSSQMISRIPFKMIKYCKNNVVLFQKMCSVVIKVGFRTVLPTESWSDIAVPNYTWMVVKITAYQHLTQQPRCSTITQI